MKLRTFSIFAICSVLAPAASLADTPPGDAPPADAPPAEPQVKVTTVAMPHPNVPDEVVVGVMRQLDQGMKKNAKLEMKDLDTRLADFAQEVPGDQVEGARAALKEGSKALGDGNHHAAVQKLDEAVSGFAKVLPFIKKQELADAMAALAVAHLEAGDKTAGRRTFLRLLVWRSDYSYDVSKLPPKYLGTFEDVQKEAERLKQGSLRIGSNPPGAQAYVDGKFYGVTPCAADRLTVGEHFVTLKKEGYKKTVTPAEVQPKKEKKVEIELVRAEKYLIIEQAITALEKNLGKEDADPEMDNFKQVLFVDAVAFVRAKAKGGDAYDFEVLLYDLRTKKRAGQVALTINSGQVENQTATLATNLFVGFNYEGEIAMPAEAPVPKQVVRPPVYKTWWFWTAVAGGVVVLGGAAGAIGYFAGNSVSCQTEQLCPVVRY